MLVRLRGAAFWLAGAALLSSPTFVSAQACSPELQAQIRLTGTIYDDRHPERSLAILGGAAARKAVYRCGSRWGQLQILEVHPRAVLVASATDGPCWLRMTRPARISSSPAAPPVRPARRNAFSSTELEHSIQKVQSNVYRVDRSLLERAFSRASALASSTRTRTIQQHGAAVGLMFTRIASGGLFESLGLKRGDTLKTLNGFQVASVEGMLEAKTQLTSAPRLSLALVRGGRQMTIEYRLY